MKYLQEAGRMIVMSAAKGQEVQFDLMSLHEQSFISSLNKCKTDSKRKIEESVTSGPHQIYPVPEKNHFWMLFCSFLKVVVILQDDFAM